MAEELTRAEFEAGVPCPGCGLGWTAVPWPWRVRAEVPEGRRVEWDAEEARFADQHGSCAGPSHALAGYLTVHCGVCCPPPPPSRETAETVRALLGR